MPSGSHSGGGGSHFGGSSGGSHFGDDGSFGGGFYRPRRNVIIFWGGRHYHYSEKSSVALRALITLFFVSLIFAIIFNFTCVTSFGQVKKIEQDYTYYQEMISNAEQNAEYLKIGKVTGHFYNEDAGKWYFTYSLPISETLKLEGYSFSLYTLSELKSYPVNSSIEIAVDFPTINSNTDSVPMNYKDTDLMQDGEYVHSKNTANGSLIASIICYVASAGCVAGYIVTAIKNGELKEETSSTPKPTQPSIDNAPKDVWKCEYCGNINKTENQKCTQCGAKRNK